MSTFVIACGGTGGHLAPGVALAEALMRRGHRCSLLISTKTVDARLAEKYLDIDFLSIPGAAFSLNPWRLCLFVFGLVRGYWMSVRFLSRVCPKAIVGFGGFLTLVVGLAGLTSRCPLILHEGNRRPGRAVRWLARFARRVYLPEEIELTSVASERVRHCGYPVRSEICRLPKAAAQRRLGVDGGRALLVVLGGSQGAACLNDWVSHNARALVDKGVSVYVIYGPTQRQPQMLTTEPPVNGKARVYGTPFSEDMAAVLSSADVVISRAGAGSLAEIIRCRVPSVLVPYPYAADDHQSANASFMVRHKSARVVVQSHLDRLLDEVLTLIFDVSTQRRFRRNLQHLDTDSGLEELINDLEAVRENFVTRYPSSSKKLSNKP